MITLENITQTFGTDANNRVRALDAVSLTVTAGQFVVVIGTNGSGKSTLLNTIAGTTMPERGSVTIDGINVTRMPAHRRARWVGRVFQNPLGGTAPSMTVAENLRMAALRGLAKRLTVGLGRRGTNELREHAAALGMGLEDRMQTPMGLLSGGQRQALTLLMATLRQPRILLLDEHTAALDPRSAEQVMALTSAIIARNSLTALMVTHDMLEAAGHGNRLVMMHAGGIALDIAGQAKAETTPEMLLERFAELRRATTRLA